MSYFGCKINSQTLSSPVPYFLKRVDKRAPDFNGDREVMEYQGLDPDARGPFVFSNSGGMIRPA